MKKSAPKRSRSKTKRTAAVRVTLRDVTRSLGEVERWLRALKEALLTLDQDQMIKLKSTVTLQTRISGGCPPPD